jgi:hypothetical protein
MSFFKQEHKFMTIYIVVCLVFGYIGLLVKSVIVELRKQYAY